MPKVNFIFKDGSTKEIDAPSPAVDEVPSDKCVVTVLEGAIATPTATTVVPVATAVATTTDMLDNEATSMPQQEVEEEKEPTGEPQAEATPMEPVTVEFGAEGEADARGSLKVELKDGRVSPPIETETSEDAGVNDSFVEEKKDGEPNDDKEAALPKTA